ncbi:MAG: GerW family sporulation protein [Christensenellales bacterium]
MHPIENIMQTAMSEIKEMVDVNTVIGDPVISTNGSTVIPISRVCFGFVAGGGEYGEATGDAQQAKFPFSGGAGSGVSINPIGFLVVDEEHVELLSVSGKTLLEHVIESVPQFIVEIKDALKRCRSQEVE